MSWIARRTIRPKPLPLTADVNPQLAAPTQPFAKLWRSLFPRFADLAVEADFLSYKNGGRRNAQLQLSVTALIAALIWTVPISDGGWEAMFNAVPEWRIIAKVRLSCIWASLFMQWGMFLLLWLDPASAGTYPIPPEESDSRTSKAKDEPVVESVKQTWLAPYMDALYVIVGVLVTVAFSMSDDRWLKLVAPGVSFADLVHKLHVNSSKTIQQNWRCKGYPGTEAYEAGRSDCLFFNNETQNMLVIIAMQGFLAINCRLGAAYCFLMMFLTLCVVSITRVSLDDLDSDPHGKLFEMMLLLVVLSIFFVGSRRNETLLRNDFAVMRGAEETKRRLTRKLEDRRRQALALHEVSLAFYELGHDGEVDSRISSHRSQKSAAATAEQLDSMRSVQETKIFFTAALNESLYIPAPFSPPDSAASPTPPVTEEQPGDPLRRFLNADPELSPLEKRQERLYDAATRITDPSYSLHEFHDDMIFAFPELRLYLSSLPQRETTSSERSNAAIFNAREQAGTSSGRIASDEYKRTIGALFAVCHITTRLVVFRGPDFGILAET